MALERDRRVPRVVLFSFCTGITVTMIRHEIMNDSCIAAHILLSRLLICTADRVYEFSGLMYDDRS